ncbi:MAG: hypothetical protein ACLGHN_07985 [Bacteriovoracia bacterium]
MSRKNVPTGVPLSTLKWEKNVMKLALIFLLFSAHIWARPIVLLGHFDAFGRGTFNNSERVAKALMEKTKGHPDFDLRLCALQTVFDKSFFQLEDCMKSLPDTPALILGLGESNCNLKIETIVKNLDSTKGPDNDGNERFNSVIIPDADEYVGLNYPLPQMYCSLSPSERKIIQVSNSAGSFVCNNIAYQFAWNYQETVFGFIHVPAHFCRGLPEKTQLSVNALEKMIAAAVKETSVRRLPTTKKELKELRREYQDDQCLYEFYKRSRGIDEKGFWRL